ncbi:ligand-binding sensor domain-containing protein [Membranihabitans maritimus]|uniref:ligand-binding sensor domain-containing protein n=1 Tax=Membranihabitans maritimus TaxID=2904244 RepID=UPI001F00CB98|nr:sensor histidine kinase [Membranihabitans maritimus]
MASQQLWTQNQNLYFDNYSSHEGLSQNSCYAISQDANGFMWFATQDGLNRYDGKEFQVYLPGGEKGGSLPSNHISSLHFDPDRKVMWIGTVRGLSLYRQDIDSIVPISKLFPFASGLESLPIRKIYQSGSDEFWVVTQNSGLIYVNLATKAISRLFTGPGVRTQVNGFAVHQGEIVTSVGDRLYWLMPKPDGFEIEVLNTGVNFSEIKELYSFRDRLWIGTYTKGCFYMEGFGREGTVKRFEPASVGGIGTFQADRNGNLWIGTRGNGIIVFNPDDKRIWEARYSKFDTRSLGKDFILSIFKDRQGIIWCGLSGGGISKYDPLKYQFENLKNDPLHPTSLPGNMVFEVFESATGQHYIGTQNKGLIQWNFEDRTFYEYPFFADPGVPENTVYDIVDGTMNSLWIASWGGLIHFDLGTGVFKKYVEEDHPATQNLYALHPLKYADSLLITGENGTMFFSLEKQTWYPCLPDFFGEKAYIGRHIYEGENGMVWICTEGGGLIRLDYKRQVYEVIEKVRNISNNSRYLLKDGSNFWIATDNGIVIYDYIRDTIVKHISFGDINRSNVCYSIRKGNTGDFWVGTNFGLVRISPGDYGIQIYNLGNGLQFLEYNTACTLAEEDGTLVFGGVGGITIFNPSEILDNTFSPDPIITGVRVNDKSRVPSNGDPMSFPHWENYFVFEFTANNFSNQERNVYKYRISGLSEKWVDNGNDHFASFNSIPPGSYTFQVKSANSDGVWSSNMAQFEFVILPPWWESWWFLLLLMLVSGFLIYLLIKRRITSIRNKAELKQRIYETEMMALRAQMNPHFIFNCLNSIDAFIQSNDKYQATMYLNKFAKLLRNVLDSSKQDTVTFSRDFETLKLYLELEELRNENKFTTILYADKILLQDDFKVPPLLIQPYVENAILHGLKYKHGHDGVLRITAKKLSDRIKYIIEDNGVGRNGIKNGVSKNKTSYGMKMSSDRVKYFNGEENASVVITDLMEDGEASGTRVEVLLDLK